MKKINFKALAALLILCLTVAVFACACNINSFESDESDGTEVQTTDVLTTDDNADTDGDEDYENGENDKDGDNDKKPQETTPTSINTEDVLSDGDMPTLGWDETAENE